MGKGKASSHVRDAVSQSERKASRTGSGKQLSYFARRFQILFPGRNIVEDYPDPKNGRHIVVEKRIFHPKGERRPRKILVEWSYVDLETLKRLFARAGGKKPPIRFPRVLEGGKGKGRST